MKLKKEDYEEKSNETEKKKIVNCRMNAGIIIFWGYKIVSWFPTGSRSDNTF